MLNRIREYLKYKSVSTEIAEEMNKESEGRMENMVSKEDMEVASTLELKKGGIYLDGEELPNVMQYGINYDIDDYADSQAESNFPMFTANGILEDSDGKPLVRFGDFVEYNIRKRVKLVDNS